MLRPRSGRLTPTADRQAVSRQAARLAPTHGGEAIAFALSALDDPKPRLGGDDGLNWHAGGAELNELVRAAR